MTGDGKHCGMTRSTTPNFMSGSAWPTNGNDIPPSFGPCPSSPAEGEGSPFIACVLMDIRAKRATLGMFSLSNEFGLVLGARMWSILSARARKTSTVIAKSKMIFQIHDKCATLGMFSNLRWLAAVSWTWRTSVRQRNALQVREWKSVAKGSNLETV